MRSWIALAESLIQTTDSVVQAMFDRADLSLFKNYIASQGMVWEELVEDELLLDEFEYYLRDEYSIKVDDEGRIVFWSLDQEQIQLIGDLPVVLHHYTSSTNLESIRKHGLLSGQPVVNGTINQGVYLTTNTSGAAIDSYHRRAVQASGEDSAHGIEVSVKMFLSEIQPDQDDEGITSGRTQFVADHVPPSRIFDIRKVW